jgi:uncharacterized protein with GYD domain
VEKTQQKYFTFVKLNSKGATTLYDEIMSWKQTPMDGVKLEEAYQTFGRWDFAILFSANSNENALHFVGDAVRPIQDVLTTRTIPIAPLKKWV